MKPPARVGLLAAACLLAWLSSRSEPFMPDDSRTLKVGPVLLTMPDGCVPEIFLNFTGPDEKLEFSLCSEATDAEPKTLAERNMAVSKALAGDAMKVLREKPGQTGDRLTYESVIKAGEPDGKVATMCQYLTRLRPKLFLDISFQFGSRNPGGLEDFDRMIQSLHVAGDKVPAEKPKAPPSGWILREDIPRLTIQMRSRLKRTTAYSFADARRGIRWVAEGWVLGQKPEAGTNTIPPEIVSPMRTPKEDSFASPDVAGTLTTVRTVDPESGKAGERVVRAEVVVEQKVRMSIRGTGPDAAGERLDADLKFILNNLVATKK